MQARKDLECDIRTRLCFTATWPRISSIAIAEPPWVTALILEVWVKRKEARALMKLVVFYKVGAKLLVLVAQLCPTLCNTMGCKPTSFLCPWDFPGKNTGVGCHSLLQGIFPTQWLNQGLLLCRQILYHLVLHQVGAKLLEVHLFFAYLPVYWKYFRAKHFSFSFCIDNSVLFFILSI